MNLKKQSKMRTMGKLTFWLCCVFVTSVFGQKQTKEFKETFNVNSDVELSVNTVNTDVVFDTWNKDVVEVTATMEIEGLTAEEAQKYFDKWSFEAIGNSAKVKVSTKGGNDIFVFNGVRTGVPLVWDQDFDFDINFDFDDPMIALALEGEFEVPAPPNVLLKMGDVEFDYEAFEKEGEAYLAKWKEEWDKNFDKKKLKDEMAKWGEELEKRRVEIMKRREEIEKNRQERLKEREERMKEREEERKARQKEIKVIRSSTGGNNNIFFYDSSKGSENGESEFVIEKDGKTINVKVKKKIHIKLPKDAKLKINVRHGEVKLAENSKNINATLSYARLLAPKVQGDNTVIESSFAPVEIGQWNNGKLILNFAKDVAIKSAANIQLVSNSSDVVINRVSQNANIEANSGRLRVGSVDSDFAKFILYLSNVEGNFDIPNAAYRIKVQNNRSTITLPETIKLIKNSTSYQEGYNVDSTTPKLIYVDSSFCRLIFN